MKVLYIDVNCKNSSTGNIVYDLFSECKKNSIEASVCYGRGPRINEPNIYKFGIDIETKIHAFLTRITGYTGIYSYFSTRRLINFIKKFKPDVVHIHELHAYFVNIKSLLVFLRNNHIRVVFTNHCEFLYTGKCGVAYPCNRYIIGCGQCPKTKEYPKSLIFDKTKRMLKIKKSIFDNWGLESIRFVYPSIFLLGRGSKSFIKKFRSVVINNSLDSSVFIKDDKLIEQVKTKYQIPTGKKIVLMIAPFPMSKIKGGEKVIELARSMLDTDYHFLIVGKTKTLNPGLENVTFLGPVYDCKEKSALYYSSYCTIIPSSFESFSMVSAESQCCGTPVMYFDVGGIKETIINNSGHSVEYPNIEGFKKALIGNIFDCVDRANLSESAQLHYSRERMFKDYLEIYKELCD